MAKQGQHNEDARDADRSRGHNKPRKSVTITAGTPKKHETYAEQARRHEDPGRQAQAQKNEWREDTRDPARLARRAAGTATRAREGDLTGNRSGSDSNASRRTRGG
jgi:hypothetical protein